MADNLATFEMKQAGHSYFNAKLVWKIFHEFFICVIDNIQMRTQNHVGPMHCVWRPRVVCSLLLVENLKHTTNIP